MNVADLLARLALHFMDRFTPHHAPPFMPPPSEEPPAAWFPIPADPHTRDWVWQFCSLSFPGGRTQFEAACNSGWVRMARRSWGFQVEVGPPPAGDYAPPRSEEAPPPPKPKPEPDRIALAMKSLGYRKLDTPTPAEVKERFRDLAKRHHPDLATTPAKREKATTRMATINHAYQLLKGAGRAL